MKDNTLLWIWLTTLRGMTAAKITSLMDKFTSVEEIYSKYNEEDFKNIALIRQNDIKELINKDTNKAEKIINKIKVIGADIITFESSEYPKKLKALPNPPYVLYVRGQLPDFEDRVSIGVVGIRDYSDYGKAVTIKLSYELSKEGITIVSGMARGIDTFAAVAAMRAGGKTVAVLGSGIDVIYPPENVEVMKKISQNGAVISEYPPGTEPFRVNFPERNRIIAALSDGLLVTEAPKKSGALITAKYASEIGKTIFSVPGNVFAPNCVGTNSLIKAGYKMVTHPKDILEEYSYELSKLEKKTDSEPVFVEIPFKKAKRKKNSKVDEVINEEPKQQKEVNINDRRFSELSEDELKIVKILIKDGKTSVDELIRKSDLKTATVNQMLPLMEIDGLVKRTEGNFYIID